MGIAGEGDTRKQSWPQRQAMYARLSKSFFFSVSLFLFPPDLPAYSRVLFFFCFRGYSNSNSGDRERDINLVSRAWTSGLVYSMDNPSIL